jgi:hypothetical protein
MLSVSALVRSGAALSVIIHAVIVAAAFGMLASPKLFEASREPVVVDIVAPSEVPGAVKEERPKGEQPMAPAAQPQSAPPPQPQSAAAPPRQQKTATPAPAQQPTRQSIFDAAKIPALLDLVTPAESTGLEAPAENQADLTAGDVAAFKEQLRKCWNPPAGLADEPKLKVVLRVFLSRSGALTAQPVLLAASASASGPALVQTALAALRRCQPFSTLPADRYKEWKVLDLTLSPADMAGG